MTDARARQRFQLGPNRCKYVATFCRVQNILNAGLAGAMRKRPHSPHCAPSWPWRFGAGHIPLLEPRDFADRCGGDSWIPRPSARVRGIGRPTNGKITGQQSLLMAKCFWLCGARGSRDRQDGIGTPLRLAMSPPSSTLEHWKQRVGSSGAPNQAACVGQPVQMPARRCGIIAKFRPAPLSLRTNWRVVCPMRLRIGDRDCTRRSWQVL